MPKLILMSTRILIVFGTRPEAIKLAPVYQALGARSQAVVELAVARQHDILLDQALSGFDLEPDYSLDVQRQGMELAELASVLLRGLNDVIATVRPDRIVVQGDTTTAFAGALAGFYQQVPVAHVEAGLRTGDPACPFPEEINRRLIASLANLHFAPTADAARCLESEGVTSGRIVVTGNTGLDALAWTLRQPAPEWPEDLLPARPYLDAGQVVLVTAHRREHWHGPLAEILQAVNTLADMYPDLAFIFPIHPNPLVRQAVSDHDHEKRNVLLVEPLRYREMARLISACRLVLTDSGGLQEEAPMLDKPVLVLREKTERVEGERAGTLAVIGTDPDRIVAETRHLLTDQAAYAAMANAKNPYGDGHAASRIASALLGAHRE